ncbi:MAG: adenylate/guanylate cyclase domain-containing protein [Saprospiraceae bacterium]|nr:adenylate/guanylate cyclase domain-containing protein [Saprospiraceae bacterium]
MSKRPLIGLTFCFALCASTVLAQSVAELENRLRNASDKEERWKITYTLARSLLSAAPDRAAGYAQDALSLSLEMQDKRREAEAALVAADIAWRGHHAKEAAKFYAQAKDAAVSAAMPDVALETVEKLQEIALSQQDFKAAFEWGQERARRMQEKNRRLAEQQAREQAASNAALLEEKKRENHILIGLLAGFVLILTVLYYARQRSNRRIRGEMAEKNAMIEEKRRRSEQLLLNILPPAVAAELTVRNKVAARRYERATVMFIDFVGFTKAAERLEPEVLVAELDYCFSKFDDMIGRNRIEKIKTVGDAYICASGLSDRNERPVDMIRVALQIQDFLQKLKEKRELEGRPSFEARIGIHFGPVVAGVVGTKKFAYDIWGDAVNIAARMEEACEPGRVNVSGAAQAAAQDDFQWEYRGKIATKNKLEMDMHYALAPAALKLS